MKWLVSVDFHGRLTHKELEDGNLLTLDLMLLKLRRHCHKGYSSVAVPGKEAVVGGWMLR